MVSIPGQITGMDDAVKVQEMVSESLKKTYKGSKSSSSWTLTNDHHTSPQFDYPLQLLTYIFHSIFPYHFKQSPLFEIKYLKNVCQVSLLGARSCLHLASRHRARIQRHQHLQHVGLRRQSEQPRDLVQDSQSFASKRGSSKKVIRLLQELHQPERVAP